MATMAGLVLLAGCGDADTDASCIGVADRWATLQQGYLDRLGDAGLGELDPESDRVRAADEWFGPAMIEQARDADAVDCTAVFRAGAPLLCARTDRLAAAGPVGQRVVDDLASECADD
ncbi:MAG: hypothetical protein AAGF02_14560 [Actinomycetota bacterium]